MSKRNIIIIGSGGHASVVIDIVEKVGDHTIIGLIDSFRTKGNKVMGYEILGDVEDLPGLSESSGTFDLCIAVGDNWQRHLLYEKVVTLLDDVDLPAIIHPSAQIARSVKMGRGVVVMAGVVINSRTTIGDLSILNTNSGIDHDCELRHYGSLAPGVVCGGNVSIGAFSAIGIGSTVSHGMSIGDHVVIGAGSLVLKDCEPHHVYYGRPAEMVRKRAEGEAYL